MDDMKAVGVDMFLNPCHVINIYSHNKQQKWAKKKGRNKVGR